MSKILLTVVSQEGQLIKTKVDQITVQTVEGEITVLPKHIALFSKLKTGELKYLAENKEHSLVVSNGFMNVLPDSEVTIIVDSATLARDISIVKAKEAIEAAKKTIKLSTADRKELLMAEASLKKALLEIHIAQKSKKTKI